MALQMQRAFNSKMITRITKYSIGEGHYDDTNEWIEGTTTSSTFLGVLTTGNKFSELEKGISIHNEVGGIRTSNYKTLYIADRFTLDINDKISFKGNYFNVLQQTEEDIHGFNGYIVEKSKNWSPP